MDDEAGAWKEVGRRLGQARQAMRPKLSKRQAAQRAGFSEIVWRQLEAGERQIAAGIVRPPNPRDDNLEAAALVVGLDPAEIFALVGRDYLADVGGHRLRQAGGELGKPAALSGKIGRLNDAQRAAVEAIVDQMLGDDQ